MSARHIPQFLLAAPTSGAGKTTVACGLMAALRERGLRVQPYKCGPDYIDTKYHLQACHRPSINIDRFMATDDHLRALYARYAADADACVVEGMMGMYDGYSRDAGSSADIARLLHLPVVLVVDARSAAYSMAPLLAGFVGFRPDVRVAGVIFNRVGSDRHYDMLREVCADLRLTCFGRLPRRTELEVGSRYLGLDFSRQQGADSRQLLVSLIEQYVDIPLLLQETTGQLATNDVAIAPQDNETAATRHIVVAANDESFSFIYQAHIDRLKALGRVTFFNPEQDFPIPVDTDLLYLPGGYPEKHAAALARAERTKASIADYIAHGGRTLAECGGMIYLSRGIYFDEPTADHRRFEPMVGALPFAISALKAHRRLSLGYRSLTIDSQPLRGHEFHYTQFMPDNAAAETPQSAYRVYNARGEAVETPVYRYKRTVASYTHLYWADANPLDIADGAMHEPSTANQE